MRDDTAYEELFSFPIWYPRFKDISIEAAIVPVPEEVLEYLHGKSGEVSRSSSEEDLTYDWGDGPFYFRTPPNFASFNKKLKDAINNVGGQAFLKSNWHAATDVAWYPNNLKCTCIDDIYFLLRNSEVLNKDMRYEFQLDRYGIEHCLVLKKWINVHPGREFRCYVKDDSLIGITQRDGESFYGFVFHNKYTIMRKIINFFQEHIRGNFRAANYVFDVLYLAADKIKVLDFQPLDEDSTEGLLFKWEELCEWVPRVDETGVSPDAPDFRFIGPT